METKLTIVSNTPENLFMLVIFLFLGWFAYMSTVLVNEKKKRQKLRRSSE
jgi:hypothetical protein